MLLLIYTSVYFSLFLLFFYFLLCLTNLFVFSPSFLLTLNSFLSFLSPSNSIIMTQYIFQSFLRFVYHAKSSRILWMLIFVRVIPKSQFTISFFKIILFWRLIQTKNIIMKKSTPKTWASWRNCWTNNSFCSCVKNLRLGVCTSRIFILCWVLGGYSGLASVLAFSLVNNIYSAWSSVILQPHRSN